MWLSFWQDPGSTFPAYAVHATRDEAEAAAVRKSGELGVEVAVVEEEA